MAVGYYEDAKGGYYALIESLAGGTWTAVQAPEPSDGLPAATGTARLTSISCQWTGSCTAVGSYATTSDQIVGLIDTYGGKVWAGAQSPLPPNAATNAKGGPLVTLRSVSCSAAGYSAASGDYDATTGYEFGLLLNVVDGAVSATQAPEPSGAGTGSRQGAGVAPVSCSAGACVGAEGFEQANGNAEGALVYQDTAPSGYYEAATDGGLFSFGVPFQGSMGGKPLNEPIVASVVDPLTGGYYEVASDGGIFAFHAPFYGSMGGKPLDKPIVGMAVDTRTGGYWEVASDGGMFSFHAPFYGSMGGKPLNKPVVGMAFDPATGGYWEVASDGGLFSFTAPFHGSMGGKPLDKPIVGMTYDTLTDGYYEVASDGGLFAFGAPFAGSMGGKPLVKPITGMAFDYGTGGYYEVATDGGLFSFKAPFLGSMGGKPLNAPIVSMTLG